MQNMRFFKILVVEQSKAFGVTTFASSAKKANKRRSVLPLSGGAASAEKGL